MGHEQKQHVLIWSQGFSEQLYLLHILSVCQSDADDNKDLAEPQDGGSQHPRIAMWRKATCRPAPFVSDLNEREINTYCVCPIAHCRVCLLLQPMPANMFHSTRTSGPLGLICWSWQWRWHRPRPFPFRGA